MASGRFTSICATPPPLLDALSSPTKLSVECGPPDTVPPLSCRSTFNEVDPLASCSGVNDSSPVSEFIAG